MDRLNMKGFQLFVIHINSWQVGPYPKNGFIIISMIIISRSSVITTKLHRGIATFGEVDFITSQTSGIDGFI